MIIEMNESPGLFEALGDPNRRKILRFLRSGPKSAGEIATAFTLSKPTLSHHFRVLVGAGLCRTHREGNRIVYTLQSNALEDAAALLIDLAQSGRAAGKEPT